MHTYLITGRVPPVLPTRFRCLCRWTRFHAADTTTIISCSDREDEQEDEGAEEPSPSADACDTMTAAFEEALFGQQLVPTAAANANAVRGAWPSAAPISHASVRAVITNTTGGVCPGMASCPHTSLCA